MTSSPRPPTWKRWLCSSWIPLTAFLLLILASGFVGLSDDESYYWVLAQHPALGYAFHPPMVAWMIAASQLAWGWLFGPSSAFVVRFFSCLGMGVLIFLSLDWLRRIGLKEERRLAATLALASFAGLFGLGWMMVPDIPLFLGLILAFHSAWRIGYEKKESDWSYWLLGLGMVFAVLGKYSGIMIPASAVVAIWIGPRRKGRFAKALAATVLGTALALVPIIVWNSRHDWQSILYQVQQRQEGAGISWKRYLRFWVIELFAVGPVLLFYCLMLVKRAFSRDDTPTRRVLRFVLVWMLPPGIVYCTQPLWADFKPHWAFIAWFPGALAFAWEVGRKSARLARVQMVYGLALVAFVLVSMQFPLMSLAIRHFKGSDYDPRLDVTNDLYGWTRFAQFMSSRRGPDGKLPYVTASRYQTASQAAAALAAISGGRAGARAEVERVSLIPRDLKARDEWPVIPVTTGIGPDWPELTAPVYYVGDNRYDEPPQFRSSTCIQLAKLDAKRRDLLAKRIIVWECKPL